jgi:hypothetical protein
MYIVESRRHKSLSNIVSNRLEQHPEDRIGGNRLSIHIQTIQAPLEKYTNENLKIGNHTKHSRGKPTSLNKRKSIFIQNDELLPVIRQLNIQDRLTRVVKK